MAFSTHNSPEYLTSDIFPAGVVHCFTTRRGGVSEGALASLNLGVHRGDRPENVRENYRILGDAVGFAPAQTVFTRQTHSDLVARVGRENRGEGLYREVGPERDGLITNEPGIALTCFSADCTPILLYDPVRRCVGAVHSGWRGTAAGIVYRCVERLGAEFGARPEDIRAAIGPCIGQCCFETDENVPAAMRAALGEDAEAAIRAAENGKYYVNLRLLNVLWLQRAGVRHVDVCADCTRCAPDRYWSHRYAGNVRGSLASIIMLTNLTGEGSE